jgi:hypothetical protein
VTVLPLSKYVFSAMVGMARCAVPARAVAGGTNAQGTLAFEGVAPLHACLRRGFGRQAARTSQRDVPTGLNTYLPKGEGRGEGEPSAANPTVQFA